MATNDPYSIMMGLGTMGDDHDDDLRKRRLDREENLRTRQLNEAEAIRAEQRAESRSTRALEKANSLRFDLETKLTDYTNLFNAKREAAQYGIPFKNKNIFELNAELGNFKANLPATQFFVTEKALGNIDKLDLKGLNEADAAELSRIKAMSPEELQSLTPNKALAIKAKIEPLLNVIKTRDASNVIRNNPRYKKVQDQIKRNDAQILKMVNKFLTPAISSISAGNKSAKISHGAAYSILKNKPEFKKILDTEEKQKTFLLNPDAYIYRLGDHNTPEGVSNITTQEGLELISMYGQAKIEARAMLEGKAFDFQVPDKTGKLRGATGAEKQEALNFLREEAKIKDFGNARDAFTRILPELIKENKAMKAGLPEGWQSLLAIDALSDMEQINNTPLPSQTSPTSTPTPKRPSLPGQRPAALGVDQSRSIYENIAGNQTPAPVTPRATAPLPSDVKVEGTSGKLMTAPQGGESALQIANKVLGEANLMGRFAREGLGNVLGLGDNSPQGRVNQAIRFLEQKQQDTGRELMNRGGSRSEDGISISEFMTGSSPIGAPIGTPSDVGLLKTIRKSADQLQADQSEIPQLFKQYDDIGIQLSTLRKAIEGQAGQKLPLGQGSKQ